MMDRCSERVEGNQCEEDDDADLEEYVEKSVRRFIGNSQSAHANLAQIASRSFPQKVRKHSSLSEEDEDVDSNRAEEEDSDEEFYVHLALLPFRKSKSTAAGLVCSAALDSAGQPTRRSYRPVNSQSMANFESQQRRSLAADVGLFASHRPSIDVVWPEPDDHSATRRPSAHPTVDLRRGDVLRVDAEKTEETADQLESCWSAPSHISDASASSSSSSSSLSNDLSEDSDDDEEFENRVERVGRSWSAPPRIDLRPNSPIDGYSIRRASNELFTVRPLNGSIVRSFSCDDVKRHRRRHQFWSNSCYALSVADENDEDRYLSDGESENLEERMRRSRAPSRSPVGSDRRSPSFAVISSNRQPTDQISDEDDEEEEKMDEEGDDDEFGVGRSAFSATDPSESEIDEEEEENEEEVDEFTETLGATLLEFSARRRSQFFIPSHRMSQSKSDSQLGLRRSVPMFFRRPRTPCFGASTNDLSTNDPNATIFQEFGGPADVRIRHSETYHGTSNRFSAPGEFASELKRRLAENEREKQKIAEEIGVDELVESFAVEKEETEEKRRDSIERRRDSQFERWIPQELEEPDKPEEPQEPKEQKEPKIAETTKSAEELSTTSEADIPTAESDDEMAERRLIAEFFGRPDSLPDSWRLAAICVEQRNRTENDEVRIPEEMTAQLVEAAVDEDRMSIRSVGGDLVGIPMADDDEPPLSPLRAPPPRRRRSPPIASEDELSDSEISELEKRLASGPAEADSGDEAKSVEFDENMPSQACQSPDIDVEMARRAYLAQMMPTSSSMPTFPADLRHRLSIAAQNAANLSADERAHLEETAQWLRKSQTQQNFAAIGAEPPAAMTRSMFGDLRRRLLPIRPDDPMAQTSRLPVSSAAPPHVGRRLPALPEQQDTMTNIKTPQPATQSAPQRPPLPSHPAFRPPPRGAIASQMGHAHDYQLSYGIDMSMMRSVTNYGMEDSYYEDGLNGNPHSPYERKSRFSPNSIRLSAVPYSSAEDSSGISSFASSEQTPSYGPTHRVQFTFVPRHDDEVLLEIGDALRVDREYEDHWCYGTNLRTGHSGLFPAAHVCEIDLVDEIATSVLPSGAKAPIAERDTFYLTMLASIEVAHHKGNDVLVEAINKVCEMYQRKEEILVPQTVLMEISFRGVHVIDKRKKDFFRCPTFDYFYGLQNISFCGAHPKQLRYFGFITKHPLLPRFACHVFLSNESTQSIVESIGRAFKRSYDEYMAFAHPTEDIYIE